MPGQNNQSSVKSSYLEYLPALFRDDEFMGQFLLIFESILKPVENTVDNLPLYFDSLMTPEPSLPHFSINTPAGLNFWISLLSEPVM